MAGSKGSRNKKRPGGKRPTPSSGQARRPRPTPPAAKSSGGPTAPAAPAAGSAGPAATPGSPPKPGAPSKPAPGSGRAKPTRTERLEAARRARKRKALLVRVAVVVTIAVIAGVIATIVMADRRAANAERERLTAGSCTFDTRNDSLSAPPNNHVAPASYDVDPPSGGNHAPQDAPAGVYGTANPAPPDSRLVHSLEHGYVVIWHRPDLGEEDMAAIGGVFDRYSGDVLVVPRPSLKVKVAATSWGKRLLCSEVEPSRLAEFVRLYRNESPEPRS